MGITKVASRAIDRTIFSLMKLSLLGFITAGFATAHAQPTPPDLLGTYRILQSRALGLTFNGGYALQDGQLVLPGEVNRFRLSCRADRSTFDDFFGSLEIFFSTTRTGANRALFRTIPGTPQSQTTRIDCVSNGTIRGFLDLQVALGRIVELTR